MPLRIATWNLERAAGARKRADAQHRMDDTDADVWVLTESRRDLSPGADHRLIAESAPRHDTDGTERWVTIWTRLAGGVARPTRDDQFTACARIAGAPGGALHVYGTVLPWRGSTWRGRASAGAEAYAAALSVQRDDWRELKSDGELCVAGDFNQDLSSRAFYWSRAARKHLEGALCASGLTATTASPNDPVSRLTDDAEACIDHVCVSLGLMRRLVSAPRAWRAEFEGRRISDHPGIVVTFSDA